MKYLTFTIENYRAIEGPLEIKVPGASLMPIIGINECGKTTLLHAILSFDRFSDSTNHSGRHLEDAQNLYVTEPRTPVITAEIEISKDEIAGALRQVKRDEDWAQHASPRRYSRQKDKWPGTLKISRDLDTKSYTIHGDIFNDDELNNALVQQFLRRLPYILYFDDFQDAIEERVEIIAPPGRSSEWLMILERLFKATDKSYSVHNLKKAETRQRKSIISRVTRKLNETLTREWQNFRLDDSDALAISIDYEEEGDRQFLRFEIVETDASGDKHFFFIRDRSKGFYWFFNFVMKLEFNPKLMIGSNVGAIYVLDEPGSYLHASAQEKLCKKLRQLSDQNIVIYCTHSHHLLDPNVIPLSSIRIAEKDPNGRVRLYTAYSYPSGAGAKRTAFQPIYDALRMAPFDIELGKKPVLLVEGMVDYYIISIFSYERDFDVVPGVGADSMKYYVSLMVAWQIPFKVLWDSDNQGKAAMQDATRHFGSNIATQHFLTLDAAMGQESAKIIQNLVDGEDLRTIRTILDLPKEASFDKTLGSLFYSSKREQVLNQLGGKTKGNVQTLVAGIWSGMTAEG